MEIGQIEYAINVARVGGLIPIGYLRHYTDIFSHPSNSSANQLVELTANMSYTVK